MNSTNNIGAARREFERRAGLKYTQEQAARDFGVSVSAYRNWEQGRNLPSAGVITLIAQKYGCSVDYLVGDVDRPANRIDAQTGLTRAEQELLALFQSCAPSAQAAILAGARGIAQSYKEVESALTNASWRAINI